MIKEYLGNLTNNIDNKNKKEMEDENSAPCKLCGSKDFIQLFRNVIGEISGSMQGNFSLFGGSISGRIDGYTKTLPVLSCKKCQNEREIATWEYTYERDIFWGDMHNFYFGIDKGDLDRLKEIKQIYLENPVETRNFMKHNHNFDFSFYNEIVNWDTKTWVKAGFKIPKIKKQFLFWKWETYPTWED